MGQTTKRTKTELIEMFCWKSCIGVFCNASSTREEKCVAEHIADLGGERGQRKREREHRKHNKRQQNRIGTQWSWAQHTRTGCNCVVLDWPWRIPAGTAWWMGLTVTTSRIHPPFLPPPPPLLSHVLYSLPVATINPPSSTFPPLPKKTPKPHTLFSCRHPTGLICIQCA